MCCRRGGCQAPLSLVVPLTLTLTLTPLAARAVPPPAPSPGLQLTGRGLECEGEGAHLGLRPSVLLDGRWITAGPPRLVDGRLSCSLPGAELLLERAGADQVRLRLRASRPLVLGGFALEGEGQVPGARAWLSNGFQSWSQSGVLSLGELVGGRQLERALRARGGAEERRGGRELSWEYSFVAGDRHALVAGATTAERFRSWVQVGRGEAGTVRVRLVSGGAGERIRLRPGQEVAGERWYLRAGSDLGALLERYGASLPSRARGRSGEVGWNSWYELFGAVDERAVRANASRAAAHLGEQLRRAGLPPRRPAVYLDDGWERRWGEWEPNAKFPSGLARLAADLRRRGIAPGLWLAPLLVDERSALVTRHPEWFVGGERYRHPSGVYRVLDVTHPGAAAHLQGSIRRLVAQGFERLKIDFLAAGTCEGARHREVTGMEAYRLALRLIREAAGEQTHLLACGAPGIASFPHVDAWRVGPDIAVSVPARWLGPARADVAAQARNLGARWFLSSATTLDADPLLLRRAPRSRVVAAGWVVALAGGGLFLSDDLRRLPPSRLGWGQSRRQLSAAVGGRAARPDPLVPAAPSRALAAVSLWSRLSGKHRVRPPEVWRAVDGGRVSFDWRALAVR